MFDELAANIAVVGSRGDVVSVNSAWQTSASNCRCVDGLNEAGQNYFDLCRASVNEKYARQTLSENGVKFVCSS
jgi:hypothetical protein